MSFDAGSIQAELELDRSPFQRNLAAARADAKKGVVIPIRADTAPADKDTDDLKAKIDGKFAKPTTAKVTADTTDALLRVQPLVDRLAEIRDRVSTAKVDANTDDAKIKLDQIDLAARRIGLITARPRVSVEGVERANIQLDSLLVRLAAVGAASPSPAVASGSSGGGRGGVLSRLGSHAPGALPLALGASVPLIGPLVGAGLAGGASLLTPLAAGGIGAGAFGVAADSSLKKLQADTKTLTADQAAYNAATSDKTRAAAQAKEAKFWAGLSKPQQTAITNMHKLTGEWDAYTKKLQPQSFKLFATGTDIANKSLKLLLPVATAVGNEVDMFATKADAALSKPFWHEFFGQFLPGQATKALGSFDKAIGNVLTGGAHLVEGFAPLGGDFEHGLDRLTKKFESWSEGDGPAKFVKWAEKNGPVIGRDLEEFAKGVGHVVTALGPLGGAELGLVGKLATEVDKLSPGHIRDVGEALLVIAGGLKAIQAVSAVTGTLAAIRKLKGTEGAGGICGCGPGGGGIGGTAGKDAEKTAEGDAEKAAGGGVLARILSKASPKALGVDGLGLALAGTYLATQGGSEDNSATGRYRQSIQSQQAPSTQTLVALVTAVDRAIGLAHPNQNVKTGPLGVSYNAGGAGKVSNASQAVQFVLQNGTPQQVDALKKLALTYPAVKQQLDAYSRSTDNLNKLLVGTQTNASGAALKVTTLDRALMKIPGKVRTAVQLDGYAAVKHDLAELQIAKDSLSGTAAVSTVLPGGHRLQRYEPTGHVSHTPALQTSHATVTGPYGHGRGRASNTNPFATEGTTSANAPASAASTAAAKRSAAARKLATSNAAATIISYAGLTFRDELDGTEKQIRAGITGMIDRLNTAVRNKYLAADGTLVKALRATAPYLHNLASDNAGALAALKVDDAKLSSLRSNAAGFRSSTRGSFNALGDLSQVTTTPTSVSSLISILGKQDKVGTAFDRNLAALRKKGLSKKEYDELDQAGPGAAGNIVALLATASKGQIGKVNKDTDLLQTLGISTGKAGSAYVYSARIAAAKQNVAILHGDLKLVHELQRQTNKLLQTLITDGVHGAAIHADLVALTKATKSIPGAIDGAAGHAATQRRGHVAGTNH